jgi:hypothetical protein
MAGLGKFKFNLASILIICFGFLYLLLPVKMYNIDGVYYAEHLENIPWSENSFHPHHLLFLPLMHLLFHGLKLIIPSVSGMTFLQGLSAICGLLTLIVFSKLLSKSGASAWTKSTAILLLGSSYSFWHFSSDADIYIPAYLILLVCIYLILGKRFTQSPMMQFLTAALLAFSVLVHQICLAAIIPISILLILKRKELTLAPLKRFILTFSLILLIVYPLVFIAFHGDTLSSPGNFIRWISASGQAKQYFSFSKEQGRNFFDVNSRGYTNAIFALKPIEKILYDNRSGDTRTSFRLYRYFTLLTLIPVLLVILYMYAGKIPKDDISAFFAYLFVAYFLLTSIFMPENQFYRIFYLPSLIMVWIRFFRCLPGDYRMILKPVMMILVIVLLYYNASRGIIPETKYINNPWLAMTYQLDEKLVSEKDIVLFAPEDRYFTGIYRYFGKGDAIHTQSGKRLINYDEMIMNRQKYESETVDMLNSRYERIFLTRAAFESAIDPFIFTPANYTNPHPEFMILGRDRITLVEWHEVYGKYYAEAMIE